VPANNAQSRAQLLFPRIQVAAILPDKLLRSQRSSASRRSCIEYFGFGSDASNAGVCLAG
jgi:hypothetical protein